MVRTTPPTKTINQTKKKPGPQKGSGGRPPKQINYKVLDNLCKIQCTEKEIEAILEMDYNTIQAHIVEEQGKSFSEYIQEKAMGGKRSLRRKQFELAMKGDRTMLVWLGKNYLNQADKHEISGSNGGPIKTADQTATLAKLSNEKLDLLEEILTGYAQGRK